ncbi:hypothetical protein HYPSUDRAFT_1046429 [Hypholoma sublateritium FD-334 SS-4]|uniref:A-kinase anchor protein 7-like phosphoesterase domain-containing protein n=1 Tax=Hypholoma sublateritium (strain FD-334 SS-4) TaxID=945553 RepID=A0A0D2KQW6_HYPSF|nr:hypothetical protein HYPSUDRAFT_1046429 [Hypholoma sublateritium FD-334 SS-4]
MATLAPPAFTSKTKPRQSSESHHGRGSTRGRGSSQRGGRGGSRLSRPTHFLALPLHTHDELRSRKGATSSSLVEGLDTSIVIDPWRLHMTLGVMALELEAEEPAAADIPRSPSGFQVQESEDPLASATLSLSVSETPLPSSDTPANTSRTPAQGSSAPQSPSPAPRKTVSTALSLLQSLQPTISTILRGEKGVKVPLTVLDVMKTIRMRPSTPASSLTHAAEEGDDEETAGEALIRGTRSHETGENEAMQRLRDICETRPLKLHCTILNTSHRKPARRLPFAYSDVLASGACRLLGAVGQEIGERDDPDPDPDVPPITSRSSAGHPRLHGVESARNETANSTSNYGSVPFSREDSSHLSRTAVQERNEGVSDLLMPSASSSSVIEAPPSTSLPTPLAKADLAPKYRSPLAAPPPLEINLGTYTVDEVQLWVMGSHGPRNEYVSCGGVRLE